MLNFKRACSALATLALLIGSISPGYGVAATPQERGSVAVDQALRDLTNPFTVLSIAVRPGETDNGTLALYRKSLGARTVMLFATRGEAGDRSTCGDNDPERGFTQTREALETARALGADVYFLNLRDFGYSKSANEALSIWGHDDALARLVNAIRSLRPDVIITNHNLNTGDGQQQAIAGLAREAFREAANAAPSAEAGDPWSVRRLFEKTIASRTDVVVNLAEHDAVRGQSYAEIGSAASRGESSINADAENSYYKLIASASNERLEPGGSLLAGLKLAENLARSIVPPRVGDLSLLEATTKPNELVDALREKLLEKRAEGSVDDLRTRYGPEFVRVVRFTASLERALALLLGFSLEVTISDRVAVTGQKIVARAVFRNRSSRAAPVVFRMPESLSSTETNPSYKDSDAVWVAPRASISRNIEYEISKDSALTLPRAGHLNGEQYHPAGSSLPDALPVEPFGNGLVAFAQVGLDDVSIPLAALARYDTSAPVEISATPFVILKDWSKSREIEVPVRVRNRTPGALAGALWVVPLALADDNYQPARLSFAREDEEITIRLRLKLPILTPPLAPDVLIEFRREKPASPEPLGHAKIVVSAIGFEVAEDLKVGYISARSSWLADALNQLGVDRNEITIEDVAFFEHGKGADQPVNCGDLARFDTIVIDSCAYFIRPELILKNACLLKYAKEGGNLVVLDQRPDDWNLVLSRSPFAPYPIKLSKNRIAVENAPVRILDGNHPLLSKPNKISEKDFDGWVKERAVNLPRSWSTEYTALLESNDPGEAASQAGLLVARVGEGSYIFTSFNWHSQVLAMNTGAYRILANLVSLPRTNGRSRRPLDDKPKERQ